MFFFASFLVVHRWYRLTDVDFGVTGYRLTSYRLTGLQVLHVYRLIGLTGLPVFIGYKLQTYKLTGLQVLQAYRFYRLPSFYKLQITHLQAYKFYRLTNL